MSGQSNLPFMDTDRGLKDEESYAAILAIMLEQGLDPEKVEAFGKLLKECSCATVGALRLFPSMDDLVAELFDTTTNLGKMKVQGFAAAVKVSFSLPPRMKLQLFIDRLHRSLSDRPSSKANPPSRSPLIVRRAIVRWK